MIPDQLSAKARRTIEQAGTEGELLLSAISLWEFCKLVEKQRLGISCSPQVWLDKAMDMPRLRTVPLSAAIALASTTLPGSFHGDPADHMIAATARQENAVLVSKDRRMRSYRHIRCIW